MFSFHRCITSSNAACTITDDEYSNLQEKIQRPAFRDGIMHGRERIIGSDIVVSTLSYQPSFTLPMKRNIFGLYSITVHINHTPCTFIIDTGAQITGIRANIARKIGINATKGNLEVGSIGGTQKVLNGLCADHFQVGAMMFHPLPMIALGENDFSLRFAGQELLGFDGILGWDVLSQMDFELDDIAHTFKGIKNSYRFAHANMIMGSFPLFLVRQRDQSIAVFGFDSGSKTSWIGKDAIQAYHYETDGDIKGMGFGVHGMESLQITIVKDVQYELDRASIQLKRTMTGRCDIFPHFTFDGIFGNEIFRNRRIRLVNSKSIVLIT